MKNYDNYLDFEKILDELIQRVIQSDEFPVKPPKKLMERWANDLMSINRVVRNYVGIAQYENYIPMIVMLMEASFITSAEAYRDGNYHGSQEQFNESQKTIWNFQKAIIDGDLVVNKGKQNAQG